MSAPNYKPPATERAGHARQAAAGDKPTVLVIDDDEDVAKAYGKVLESAGFTAIVRTDPTDAALEVVSQRFDAIVSDINMPKISGTDLLSVVRSYDAEVPVILVTGQGSLETAIEAVALRSTEYLLKPVEPPVLLRAVRKGIERAESLRPAQAPPAPSAALVDDALSQMWLALQPIHATRGQLFGYEALLRSDHASLSRPDLLLAAAADADRLQALGRRVRSKAAEVALTLPANLSLFVNLHVSDLLDDELFDAASPLGMVAESVVLEVTERQQIEDVADIGLRLLRLRNLGFRIAVDDLGAGYSGLNSLVLLEPDLVKIDMALVRNVNESFMRQSVIKSLVELARATEIAVVAEGIETVAERDCVARLGCNYMQGYLLGKPARGLGTTG
ncbi:MAG: EAL domain-containing protein [Myxococcales bacterium]|nr:EAL domain-containing protein [Myxococcales bacterium]